MSAPSSSTQPTPQIRIERKQMQVMSVQQQLSNDVSLVLVQIPEGDFRMGSPDDEVDRRDSESPQHLVHIPGFWMGQYPVTQVEWRVVASDFPKVKKDLKPDPSHFKGDLHPVERVSWYDAVEFCDRLSAQTELIYRLPTEAEWEYACRAGTTTPFSCGATITTEIANYDGNYRYGKGVKGVYRKETTPIDHFQLANAWGLCDMHGNVWEWCLDHWHENYKDAPTDGSAWIEGGNSNRRVARGGSWPYSPGYCRSACRDHLSPGNQLNSIGFRVILAPG